MSSMGLEHTN